LQVANQVAKVATQRNVATFSEIIAVGASGAFMFFQLLRTVCDFCFSELFGHFALLKLAERKRFELLLPFNG
jgi:hypothetical protein